MATAVGDPAELLDVDVEQLTGPLADIADRDARRPVAIAQAGQAMAAEDVADRRARAADHRGEAVRPEAELVAGGQDRRDLLSGQCPAANDWVASCDPRARPGPRPDSGGPTSSRSAG